jgi:hypothetical protein
MLCFGQLQLYLTLPYPGVWVCGCVGVCVCVGVIVFLETNGSKRISVICIYYRWLATVHIHCTTAQHTVTATVTA